MKEADPLAVTGTQGKFPDGDKCPQGKPRPHASGQSMASAFPSSCFTTSLQVREMRHALCLYSPSLTAASKVLGSSAREPTSVLVQEHRGPLEGLRVAPGFPEGPSPLLAEGSSQAAGGPAAAATAYSPPEDTARTSMLRIPGPHARAGLALCGGHVPSPGQRRTGHFESTLRWPTPGKIMPPS